MPSRIDKRLDIPRPLITQSRSTGCGFGGGGGGGGGGVRPQCFMNVVRV